MPTCPATKRSLTLSAERTCHSRRALPTASREEDDLILRVPNDGNVAALRRLLEQLDDAGVEIAQLSIHTPDLDDVFFALTGTPPKEQTQ